MRVLRRAIALAGLGVGMVAGSASAGMPYSIVRQGIDNACNAPAYLDAHVKPVYLARLDASNGIMEPWRRSDADAEERAVAAAGFRGGEFAIVREKDVTLTASLVRRDANGAIGRGRNWCFVGGGLSRAGSEFVDAAKQIDWRRTQYFDASLDESQRDIITWVSMKGETQRFTPETPVQQLTIDAYKTPAELPFIDAYRAAVAGHLPSLPKAI